MAIAGELLDQTPPGVISDKIVFPEMQIDVPPDIAVTNGKALIVKFEALVDDPTGVVILIGPVVAPTGNVAVIWVLLLTVKTLENPLK